jgi:hypothetical protein
MMAWPCAFLRGFCVAVAILAVLVLLPVPVFANEAILLSGRVGQTWDLFLFQPPATLGEEGTLRPITRTPEAEGNPVFCSRRQAILATVQRADGRFGITQFSPAGEVLWTWDAPDGSVGWAQPSPWDDRLLAVIDGGHGFTDLVMIDQADGSWHPVANPSSRPGGQPAWLSPTTLLLSRVNADGTFDLVEHDLAGAGERTVVSGGRNWQVTTAPGCGEPILFVRRVGQVSGIFRLVPTGTPGEPAVYDFTPVSPGRLYDWQPSISPDGRTALYLSLRDGRFRLMRHELGHDEPREIPLPPQLDQIFHPSLIPVIP